MEEAKASRTAMRVAMRRAAHHLFDEPPYVLDDPIAVPIIGPDAVGKIRAGSSRERGAMARSVRAYMVARSRFAEDALARAVGRGTRQYVVLGAGLDTFAYRNPYERDGLRVFEVDHPATQAWKRRRLAAGGIAIPASVTHVPVNFERDALAARLQDAGCSAGAPVFFSWLGVTMYLTEAAFASTLDLVAAAVPGGGIAFDYAVVRSRLGWRERLALFWLSRRVKAAGEPFKSFFDPLALRTRLEQHGFTAIEDLDAAAINGRYFEGRRDGLKVRGGLGRVISGEKR